jgi:preprotein translocase subunit SecG
MHAVLVVIHLFVAIGLVSLILLQRSEGGALGMGGGPGGLMSGRAAGNVLTKATTALGVAFFVTSIALTVFTNATSEGDLLDRVDPNALVAPAASSDLLPAEPALGLGGDEPAAGQPLDDLLPGQPAPTEPVPAEPAPAEPATPQ